MSEPVANPAGYPTHIETAAEHPSLIKDAVLNILVEPLQAASVVLSLPGVRIFDSSEPLIIPTLDTADTDPGWYGQGELITPNPHVGFGELRLMPTDRASLKQIVVTSNELIRQANAVNIERVLRDKIVADVVSKLDTALLAGLGEATSSGSAKAITGLLNQPGVATVTADPTSPDGILAGLAAMAATEVKPTAVLMNGADFYAMAGLKTTDGHYLLQPDATRAMGYQVHGVSLVVSNKVPAGTSLMLDARQVAIVRDLNADVAILKERFSEFDSTGIRVVSRYDIGLLRTQAAVKIKAA